MCIYRETLTADSQRPTWGGGGGGTRLLLVLGRVRPRSRGRRQSGPAGAGRDDLVMQQHLFRVVVFIGLCYLFMLSFYVFMCLLVLPGDTATSVGWGGRLYW